MGSKLLPVKCMKVKAQHIEFMGMVKVVLQAKFTAVKANVGKKKDLR